MYLLLGDNGPDPLIHYANNNIDPTDVNLGPYNDHTEQTISNLLSDRLVKRTIRYTAVNKTLVFCNLAILTFIHK